jgi:hypothetical protein
MDGEPFSDEDGEAERVSTGDDEEVGRVTAGGVILSGGGDADDSSAGGEI